MHIGCFLNVMCLLDILLKLYILNSILFSGAFHTPLMELAVEPFYEALKLMRLTAPRVPVYSNFDNQIYTNPRQVNILNTNQG